MAHLAIGPASTADVIGASIKNNPDVIQDVLFSLFLIVQVHSILCIARQT